MNLLRWFGPRANKSTEISEAVCRLHNEARQNVEVARSAARIAKRRSDLITTYAQSLEFMERGKNEDR